jgi:hypothetical protein
MRKWAMELARAWIESSGIGMAFSRREASSDETGLEFVRILYILTWLFFFLGHRAVVGMFEPRFNERRKR